MAFSVFAALALFVATTILVIALLNWGNIVSWFQEGSSVEDPDILDLDDVSDYFHEH